MLSLSPPTSCNVPRLILWRDKMEIFFPCVAYVFRVVVVDEQHFSFFGVCANACAAISNVLPTSVTRLTYLPRQVVGTGSTLPPFGAGRPYFCLSRPERERERPMSRAVVPCEGKGLYFYTV